MQIGMIGLGRMGGNMTLRLLEGHHDAVVYDRNETAVAAIVGSGARGAASPAALTAQLKAPRIIWMMVPAGQPVDETIASLVPHLADGDVLIDGGNSHFKDTIRRARELEARRVRYLDAGTSGGIWGRTLGYCLMVGGPRAAFDLAEPILRTLAVEEGYLYAGPSGSGHFVKMIHNGIEYGLMQAYAEGFALMEASEFDLDLPEVAKLWNHGSVVRSWLLELTESALRKNPRLEAVVGEVADSGEGRWTVEQSLETSVPAPVITLSLMARFQSRQKDSYANRLLAALRGEFGGHAVPKR